MIMKKLFILWCLSVLSTAFVCWATDVEWEWKTDASSSTRCISLSLDWDQIGQVKIQWDNWWEYEEVFVTTGTQISSICHGYTSVWKHSASMEVLSWKDTNGNSIANDLNYVWFLNQKVTNITKLESQTLDYFVLKEASSDKLTDEQYNNIKQNLSIPSTTEIRLEISSSSNNNWNSGNSSSNWTSWSSWSWGWSRSNSSSNSKTTKTTETKTTNKKEQLTTTWTVNNTKIETKKENKTTTPKKNTTKKNKTATILTNKYNDEVKNAYRWAYENDITSIEILENARPESELLRWQMAKILVNYAVNILWKEITSIPSYCQWDDDEDWPTEEMRTYWRMACALWIMGINVSSFEPMRTVSRAQFGTALSRLLWWNAYNNSWEEYYEGHLNALRNNGYMDKIDNPKERTEIRQRVWIMLERTSDTN